MPLSKVKSTKQAKRQRGRIEAWDKMGGNLVRENKRMINKQEYTRPGSNRK